MVWNRFHNDYNLTESVVRAVDSQKQRVKRTEKEISKPKDFTDPEVLYQNLVKAIRTYHPSTDLSLVKKAYHLADDAHKDQKRKSGEPYIIHPLCVATILAELELDKETIVAGILHDVVEDTDYTLDDITNMFNGEVALLVDGVTKLGQLSYSQDKLDLQAENLRKMFLAMAKDIRVILIKLADRLHNMRTLQYMKPEKQREKARETMDIYAPIAHRLGISKIKIELDDLCLKYLQPEVYQDLEEKLENSKEERRDFIEKIVDEVRQHMEEAGIKAEVNGRVKHYFSIYKKMRNQNKTIDQIYDIFAVRIKVDTVKDCYAALGVIHELYKPIPGRFKDYIAMPKENMYQSLHTTLIGGSGRPFEIQIRTFEMHRTAEYGIAAHWKYKEGGGSINKEEEKLAWLRRILEWQQDMSDNQEFLTAIKSDLDLFTEQVYCFTPQGDVKTLPAGSTPIDFAYMIHTAVGNRMVGARVNGRQVPIEYKLQTGDRVEIITSQNSKGPSRDWLSIVCSSQARSKINQWFKSQFKEENIQKGKELIERYAKSRGLDLPVYTKPEYQKKVMRKYGLKDWNAVMAAVGHGGLKEGQVVNKLVEEYDKEHKKKITDEEALGAVEERNRTDHKPMKIRSKSGITVKGADDVSVRFSKCCSPVPGDEIIGFVTRGRGVSIHRTDCTNIVGMPEADRGRLIDAEWEEDAAEKTGELYLTEISIFCHNRTGVLVDISKIFLELKVDITSIQSRTSKQGLKTIELSFEISGIEELNHIIAKLRNVESVIDIQRTTG
ncbi:MAG: bifunctional (p)ppGpp synthetase/guanosine-3',5'-bis(diphosphate) 3'-pyrophosphohydrolase [Eubacterium sp.]|nr:bifunctional (p)ppGpp synthetase/guanosine-3',5'-bis(diphosphate) 3'-pyrophosphohydrolase [Eubacterium sp.]